MAIHDFGYRGYDGSRTSSLSRVLAIAGSDVLRTFRSRKFLFFYLLCITPALFAFGLLWFQFIVLEGQAEMAGFRPPPGLRRAFNRLHTAGFFLDFGRQFSTLLMILFSAMIGAGIVSRDRKAGALELYFTRGIRPVHYAIGKFGGVLILMLCQALFPFLLVWLFGVAVASEDSRYFARTAPLMPSVILAQLFLCGTLSLWAVALSASTESSRFALLRWAGGLFLLHAVGGTLWRIFSDASWYVVSPWKVVRTIAFTIGDTPAGPSPDLTAALVAWAIMTTAALLWLRRHLRPVEVVA